MDKTCQYPGCHNDAVHTSTGDLMRDAPPARICTEHVELYA